MANPVDQIARHISEKRYEDLPADVVVCAKRLILDTFGVAWAGAGADGCGNVYSLTAEQGGKPESSIWVHGDRVPAVSAAFVNSLFASALDFDSFHETGTLHADIVVLPAALAIAEREHCSGKDFLTAFILATDLTCRLGLSTVLRTGWFFTSVHGVIGAAAASARLLGLDVTGIKNAIGLAYLNAAGTQQAATERSLAKRLESAFAARSGVHTGLLAGAGCDGPHDILNGRFGLYQMYENGDSDAVVAQLGERYELSNVTVKRYPGCACAHAATDATLALVEANGLIPDQIRRIEVSLSPYMNRLVGEPFAPKDNPQVTAQFSVQYAVACAALFRRFGLAELENSVILDPTVGNMAERVEVAVDDANTGVMTPASVTIRMQGGEVLSKTIDAVRGTPELPLDEDAVIAKFSLCTAAGPRPLADQASREFIERITALEEIDDMGDFLASIAAA